MNHKDFDQASETSGRPLEVDSATKNINKVAQQHVAGDLLQRIEQELEKRQNSSTTLSPTWGGKMSEIFTHLFSQSKNQSAKQAKKDQGYCNKQSLAQLNEKLNQQGLNDSH